MPDPLIASEYQTRNHGIQMSQLKLDHYSNGPNNLIIKIQYLPQKVLFSDDSYMSAIGIWILTTWYYLKLAFTYHHPQNLEMR